MQVTKIVKPTSCFTLFLLSPQITFKIRHKDHLKRYLWRPRSNQHYSLSPVRDINDDSF